MQGFQNVPFIMVFLFAEYSVLVWGISRLAGWPAMTATAAISAAVGPTLWMFVASGVLEFMLPEAVESLGYDVTDPNETLFTLLVWYLAAYLTARLLFKQSALSTFLVTVVAAGSFIATCRSVSGIISD